MSNKLRLTIGALMVAVVGLLLLMSVGASKPRITFAGKRQLPAESNNSSKQRQKPTQASPQDLVEHKSRFATVEFDAPEPSDASERIKRRNKAKYFDKMHVVSRRPTSSWHALISEWDFGLPALPVAQSDAVIIVQSLTSEAYLSNDKTGVYTEFSVKIEELLKNNDPLLTADSLIRVSRAGGIVRYRSNEESLCEIAGQNMLRIGKRYLLFLKSIEQSKDFAILTGYEIGNQKVSPLDTPAQFQSYEGFDQAMFLKKVRDALAGVTP